MKFNDILQSESKFIDKPDPEKPIPVTGLTINSTGKGKVAKGEIRSCNERYPSAGRLSCIGHAETGASIC